MFFESNVGPRPGGAVHTLNGSLIEPSAGAAGPSICESLSYKFKLPLNSSCSSNSANQERLSVKKIASHSLPGLFDDTDFSF